MRDLASPTMPPQPSPPPPLATFKLPMLYYGLVVVGTAALVLLLYNLIIIKWCANVGIDHHGPRQGRGLVRARFVEEAARGGRSFEYSQGNMLASFSYRKEAAKDGLGRSSDYECAVCLSVFEQGEEVRRLPRCSHSFHASCIDMWLYSHCDCPLCRTPVVEPLLCHVNSGEHSREGLMIGSVVSV